MGNLLAGKKALITGAASGIGAGAARAFAAEGARVFLTDIDTAGLTAVAASLGAPCRGADLCDEAAVAALVQEATATLGGLDCAFNNAGISQQPATVEAIDASEWLRVITTNLTSVFYCVKYELQVMQAQGHGAIVNTASGAGVMATPWMGAYCAAKHGVLGLTRTAATENRARNIRINAVLPGSTLTPMLQASMKMAPEMEHMIRSSVPCGRFGTPEEVAQAALWLCSDRASYVSGEAMLVDMGTVCR